MASIISTIKKITFKRRTNKYKCKGIFKKWDRQATTTTNEKQLKKKKIKAASGEWTLENLYLSV